MVHYLFMTGDSNWLAHSALATCQEADRLWPQETVDKVYSHLASLEDSYPNFRNWFYQKVAASTPDARQMFVATHNDGIVGVCIAKRSPSERKLCTLWVHPEFRNSGVAGILARPVFRWLGTDKPLFTVPEERLREFRGLLNAWRFAQPNPIRGFYRPDKVEYVFNGVLKPTLNS
jgi:hypothetical protein